MKNYQLSRAAGSGAMVFNGDASRPAAICHEVEDAQRIIAALNHADALADALRGFVQLAEHRAACLGGLSDEMGACLLAGREALRNYAGELHS